jgi:molybdopterin synthase catalytic subunit
METSLLSCLPLAADKKEIGAEVVFEGVVRASEDGKPIRAIVYEAYAPMAEKQIQLIQKAAQEMFSMECTILHHIGRVAAGETSLRVVCRGKHRKETFEGCQFVVDQIKACVPIWKAEYEWA